RGQTVAHFAAYAKVLAPNQACALEVKKAAEHAIANARHTVLGEPFIRSNINVVISSNAIGINDASCCARGQECPCVM
ncbi:MAG: hypothetical protein ACRCT0_00120, partial [Plesiomonas shigelloides]